MSLSSIALTEGDGSKSLATDSIVQGALPVERQRVLVENFAGQTKTYVISAAPTTPTSGGVLVAIENAGSSSRDVYLSRIEIRQSALASSATAVTFELGRAAADGSGGSTLAPVPADPADGTTSSRVRYSTAAAPNTGITTPTGVNVLARVPLTLVAAGELATATLSFDGQGKMPKVPLATTVPLTLAISGTAAGAAPVVNLVLVELPA